MDLPLKKEWIKGKRAEKLLCLTCSTMGAIWNFIMKKKKVKPCFLHPVLRQLLVKSKLKHCERAYKIFTTIQAWSNPCACLAHKKEKVRETVCVH